MGKQYSQHHRGVYMDRIPTILTNTLKGANRNSMRSGFADSSKCVCIIKMFLVAPGWPQNEPPWSPVAPKMIPGNPWLPSKSKCSRPPPFLHRPTPPTLRADFGLDSNEHDPHIHSRFGKGGRKRVRQIDWVG